MAEIATKTRIYLDHAATTPVLPAAIAAMIEAAAVIGNPSSVHAGGRAANALVETARDAIAAWAGVAPDAIVFTSGGTEALALALHGTRLPRLLVSATEHSAVLAARSDAAHIPVDGDGLIDLAALESALSHGPALVAVQHANNETGVVQPSAIIAEMVAASGGLLLVDAVQSAGKLPLPAADFVAVSAHKLGGPPGIGALIVRNPATLTAVQKGGGQERGLRGGTPNLPGIAGFAAAVAAASDWSAVAARRDTLEASLHTLHPGVRSHCAAAPRLPNFASIGLPGVKAGTQVMALDLAGIMVSAGAACSSGKVASSHVLAAMGLGEAAGEAIRISLAPSTTDDDIIAFLAAWHDMANRLSRKAA
ncbi:cysteine desulfurase [Polymorphobacter glacialis]|uniref:Cysteine desulfurase n=1 Tax=Sandarakinorhabdus glacialis TaxID=1614636 RepID=A0A916ZQ45_9SPHN|nr:cysteine desulfurase family protein [Polymorphobacter glacialis]GGE05967.1 cysteine desulfurase [Polymorphobacter glacialis]